MPKYSDPQEGGQREADARHPPRRATEPYQMAGSYTKLATAMIALGITSSVEGALSASPAYAQTCPDGATLIGDAPPQGFKQWCAYRDAHEQLVLHGRYAQYHTTGGVQLEGTYEHGARSGLWRQLDPFGRLEIASTYQKDRLDGPYESIDEHGTRLVGQFVAGRKEGFWQSFDIAGALEAEGPYKRDRRHGIWRVRLDDGSHASGPYVDDKRHGTWTITWPDGTKRAEGTMLRGVRHGPWVEYDELGRVRARGAYRDDLRTGIWTMLDETGAKAAVGAMRGELRDGPWVEWETDGARLEGNYLDGRRDGPWRITAADDKTVLAQGNYAAGVRVGDWAELGTDGVSRFVGPYVEDQRHGIWAAFAPDGQRLGAVRYEHGVRMESAP